MSPVSHRSVRGFAQIESIIVFVVLGILLGILLAVFQKVREHSRRASYTSNLKHLAVAKLPETIFAKCLDTQIILPYNALIQGRIIYTKNALHARQGDIHDIAHTSYQCRVHLD